MVGATAGRKHYKIIDVLTRIAGELDTTVARVALAWVRARPGVSSVIIGARTQEQLEDSVKGRTALAGG